LQFAISELEETMRTAFVACVVCHALTAATAFAAEEEQQQQPPAPANAAAAAPQAPAPITISKPAPKPPGKFLVYTSFAFNVYTYLGASGTSPSTTLTPDNRAIIYQQIGAGYFVHPSVRLTLTMQFGETLTGLAN